MKVLLCLLGLFSTLAFCNPNDPVKVFAEWKSSQGKQVELNVGLEIEEKGFRVYRDTVKVTAPGWEIKKNEIPPGEKRFDKISQKEKEIYSQKTQWPITLEGKSRKPGVVELTIGYRACNDFICHFPKTKKLEVSVEKPRVRADIGGSLSQLWKMVTEANPEEIQKTASEHMWLAFLLCFLSGILTSLTPCVYPMIPITINIFGRAAQSTKKPGFNSRTFFTAVIYVAGMCVTYSLLGIVAGLTGSLFGRLMQSSFVLGGLALLFLFFALAQLGLFKIELPPSLQTKFAAMGHGENRGGIFLMGLFSGLLISPCVGPVIGGILAFVFDTSNALMGFFYFLSFSLGLGVLFLVIGGFSGFLNKIPRSGAWMIGINRVLALLMLVAAGYYGVLWAKKVGILQRSIPTAAVPGSAIPWMNDENAARQLAKQKNLPILIDFTAEWCEACHEIEHLLFQNPEVIEKMKGFIPLRLDMTDMNPANQEILTRYKVQGLPALVFVSPQGDILTKPRVSGVIPVTSFLTVLDTAAGK